LRLAETIRSTLESLALPHDQSPLGRVTVSIGIAVQVPDAEPTPVGLLRMADDALYLAKAQGRNRVHLATCTS
ncbi:MAG: diguanylate cyclase, partial [Myxococcales bacterium]